MKHKRAGTLLMPVICSLLLGCGALAQQQRDGPVAGKVTLGVAVTQAELIATGWRASRLIHADVYNEANEKIGRVGNFVVAPDGSVSVAVLDVGGFLGIGARRVAVPVQQFSQVSPTIVLPGASKDALKQMPEFIFTKD